MPNQDLKILEACNDVLKQDIRDKIDAFEAEFAANGHSAVWRTLHLEFMTLQKQGLTEIGRQDLLKHIPG